MAGIKIWGLMSPRISKFFFIRYDDKMASCAHSLCLICLKPNTIWLDFLSKFVRYDVYVVIDDNSVDYSAMYASRYPSIRFIQIPNEECERTGFKDMNFTMKKLVTGWEKATYYFSCVNTTYAYTWIIEDDVFFHSEQTLVAIDAKYTDGDLLTNTPGINATGEKKGWWWPKITIQLPPPYYCAMVCALRASPAFLSRVKDYAAKHNTLFFLEAMFPTLCKTGDSLIYHNPTELHHIIYSARYAIKDLNIHELYHPIKDINLHATYRDAIKVE